MILVPCARILKHKYKVQLSACFQSFLYVAPREPSHLDRKQPMAQPAGCLAGRSCARGRSLWVLDSAAAALGTGRRECIPAGRKSPSYVTQNKRMWNSIVGAVPSFLSKGNATRSWSKREANRFRDMALGTIRPTHESFVLVI